ncbi:glycoside hydrolase family 78 protein [Mucilaginibacter sp. BJC16-A38]|uniref:glycoside hydrolase family 78 protein n=1 Tax=Mucilaginibacter phenanthrenivorans TaxID=1234842 RepID=UPI002157E40C|nr:glycoside hydrolase family 78 protein [Mucilaginibacter phenanthrenivorans]MCR8556833.1 glycoside hydrolase family 78 protein [Mucilaginibacter phenanthrenivorans]
MKKLVVTLLLLVITVSLSAQTTVTNLTCEYKDAPILVDTQNPALSWQIKGDQRNLKQTAYRILVASDASLLQKNVGDIWDSKKTLSPQSLQIPFAGKKLESTKAYYWKVMVWGNLHHSSAWSKVGRWQMGLLSKSEWKGAKWIAYEKLPDSLLLITGLEDTNDKRFNEGKDVLPIIRKEFTLNKKISKATVFITGLGQFDLSVNGEKVGDHFLDPGWTKYDKHALYVAFDITDKLKQGKNAIGVMLGNGFYYIPGERYHKLKGAFGYPKMICRVALQYEDGSEEDIISDQSWKTAPGPVVFSSIYGGEDYDANLEQKGWSQPGFNDSKWKNAIVVDGPEKLDIQAEEPLKIFEQFSPIKVSQPKPGVWVYDMGQNASAIPFITVNGNKGAVVKLTPAELLDNKGMVTQEAVGTPVYFNYTLKGNGTESWHPQFMYYGFRYIQVEGATPLGQLNTKQLPVILALKSLHTRNSAAGIGTFKCSNNLFNKTYKLIDWAIRSNTASVFTDCPHREKLGWLEEAHLVGPSIRYNYDIATLCRKVVRDMINSQTPKGLIPDIAPEYVKFGGGFRDSPEWGSNGIIMPYYIYQWYGDKQILSESYDMMGRYAAYLQKRSKDNVLYFGLGDWYDLGPEDPGVSQLTPQGITGTAIYHYDLTILSKVARLLGKNDDAIRYSVLANEVKTAFNNTFFNKSTKQYGAGSQTANAMAVYTGIVDPAFKEAVIENIVKDIRQHNNGLTAGDIGYRYLLRVLDDAGRSDVIFDMNSRSDVPGYGYQLARGATSLTESWQGAPSSSNNHFMLGHLMEWFYSGLSGIRPDSNAVAFDKIVIRPEPVGNVSWATASYLSPYGVISNKWNKNSNLFTMQTTIPVNTTAVIYLPAGKNSLMTEGGRPVHNRSDIKLLRYENGRAVLAVGSGNYSFSVKNNR